MSSTTYIPPEGLRFRLVGYISQCAIYSRNSPEPTVGHRNVSYGEYPDEWFTLIHGSGDRAGRYGIKGQVSGKYLYSRKLAPPVGNANYDGQYEDNWFKFEPNSGQYTDNFRLVTPSQNVVLYSRWTLEPTFSNGPSTNTYSDQLFRFSWEDMKVDKIEYNLDAGRILSSTSVTLSEQLLTKKSDSEQEMNFSVSKSVTRSSTFGYSDGFTVTTGMEFSVGVPFVSGDKLDVEASTSQIWTWGKTTEYSTEHAATFSAKVQPHKTVRAFTVVNQGMLDVPYTMHLSSKSAGVKVQTTGTWHGVTSWGLRRVIVVLN